MRARMFLSLLRLGPHRVLQVFYHLPKFLKLFWRLLGDTRVSWKPKIMLLAVAVYFLVPFEVVARLYPGSRPDR